MIWSRALVCFTAVISLLLGAIWPNTVAAATTPEIVPLGSIEAGLTVPGKMDVDAAGNLYVADIKGQKVLKFGASGDLLRTYDAVAASGRGLAVSPDGSRLYISTDAQVVALSGVTGEVVGSPIDIAEAGEVDLDASGNVYVVDLPNTQIKVFDASGVFRRSFCSYYTGANAAGVNGQFRAIHSMGVSADSSEVYVAGLKGKGNDFATVQIFSLAGAYQGELVAVGDEMRFGVGVAFDADGREYYLDKLTAKLHVRPRTATADFPSPVVFNIGGTGAGQVVQPWDVAFDSLTSRFLVSSDSGEIEIYGVDGGTTPEKNVAPGLPDLISPIANGEVASATPILRFANAVDLNGDSLTYDVQVSGVPSIQYSVNEGVNGETAVQVGQDLTENSVYSWQVMAKDAELDSGWTLVQNFYVNVIEEAPSAPILMSALSGDSLDGADVLNWQASVDNDPLDTVGYLIEISTDDTFDAPVVSEKTSEIEISIGALADYQALMPGNSYFWRVTAVDSKGLEAVSTTVGNFRYETAMLSVKANLPGAKVYFAGNAAYSGKFVGNAPLELRDMAAGPYTIVVERAGCETFIAQVELGAVGSVQVNANLLLAKTPVLKKASALRSVKKQLQSAALVAPFVVDFNNDDMADLLVGDQDGAVNLFQALAMRGSKVQYGAAESLDFGQLPGTSLFVVDWNNDNKKDVLVGASDGTVSVYLQNADSSDQSPEYSYPLFLRDGKGTVINVGSQANPAVVDIDADGDKDLVVGASNGNVYLYANDGSDAAPELAIDPLIIVTMAAGGVSPYFVDWDADGDRDLLVSSAGNLVRCEPNGDGTYAPIETIVGATVSGIDPGARYFITDADNTQGKDVYVGQADGLVQIMRSSGQEFLPSVTVALLDKLAQISELAAASGVDVVSMVNAVTVEIEAGDFGAAGRAAKAVVAVSPADSEMYIAAAELIALLNQ